MAANLITVPTVRGNPGRLPRSDLFPHKWWQRWDVTGFFPQRTYNLYRNDFLHWRTFEFLHFAESNEQNFYVSPFRVVQFCCSSPVKYLFCFVIFFLFRRPQLTSVPDKPHWESNGKQ